MTLLTVNSGSTGNAYILEASSGEILLLELGVRFANIKKALRFDLSKVVGAVVSHSHQDHCKGVREAVNAGVDVYCLQETIDAMGYNNHRLKPILARNKFKVGGFQILPFELVHDVPSVGFLLSHIEMGLTAFITDTCFCEYKFPGLHNLILEANYCPQILDEKTRAGSIHNFLRSRIMASHMSLDTTKEFLLANDLRHVNNILLIHLSDSNSDARRFKQEIQELTHCTVEVATKGLKIDFNTTPF